MAGPGMSCGPLRLFPSIWEVLKDPPPELRAKIGNKPLHTIHAPRALAAGIKYALGVSGAYNPKDPEENKPWWWDEKIVLEAAFGLPIGPGVKYPVHLEEALPPYYWGLEHKHMMRDYGNHVLFITGLGLDGNDGTVTIDKIGRPKVSWQTSPKSRAISANGQCAP